MEEQGRKLSDNEVGQLSTDEVRRRRLAALEHIGATNASLAPPVTPRPLLVPNPLVTSPTVPAVDFVEPIPRAPPPTPTNLDLAPATPMRTTSPVHSLTPPNFVDDDDDDDDDENADLQAALALSLSSGAEEHKVEEAEADSVEDSDDLQAALSLSLTRDDPSPIPALPDTTDFVGSNSNPPSGVSYPVAEWYKTGEPCDVLEFHSVMWDPLVTTDHDKRRWIGQGINFRDYDPEGRLDRNTSTDSTLAAVISNHGPWGLTQTNGGPCGVLAAVQAEILRILLFGGRNPLDYPVTLNNVQAKAKPDMSEPLMKQVLAMAMAIILARAAFAPPAADTEDAKAADQERRAVRIVLPKKPGVPLGWDGFEPWTSPANGALAKSSGLITYTIDIQTDLAFSAAPKRQKTNGSHIPFDTRTVLLAHAVTRFLIEEPSGQSAPLESFRQQGGVVLFVMSLALSRGTKLVQLDMDDPTARLTSQFGHCAQELINLLLTGQSVSNVFDNTLTPSGELVCRGIQSRPAIGYLTQLESMRYLEVGGYYKTPRFPIWVVGSTSHFTVMFGDAMCLKESQSDILLEKCRRAFKAIDGGEENGFIRTESLGVFLQSLGLDLPEHGVQTLAATIEVHGAGIILWDEIWKHTSRLMTGASLESVLQLTDTQEIKDDEPPPLLLTQFGEQDDLDKKPSAKPPSISPTSAAISGDEELAKRLTSEWDSMDSTSSASLGANTGTAIPTVAAAAPSLSPMELDSALSDEELARKLQAEWNAETSSTDAVASDDMTISSFPATDTTSTISAPTDTVAADAAAAAMKRNAAPTSPSKPTTGKKQEFEKYGQTFQLYHYNGLRGGALKPFRVTRLSAEEVVGASISLMGNSSSSAHDHGDLEDVIRTKWPSSMINWLGGPPPNID